MVGILRYFQIDDPGVFTAITAPQIEARSKQRIVMIRLSIGSSISEQRKKNSISEHTL